MEVVIYAMAVICIYLAPALVANQRKHNNANAIFMLNLLLGWTFLGWVAAAIWCFTDNTKKVEA